MKKTRYFASLAAVLVAVFTMVTTVTAAPIYEEDFSGYADGDQPDGWIELTGDDTVQNNEFDIGSYRDRLWYGGIEQPEVWEIEFDWKTSYGHSIWSTIQFAPNPDDLDTFIGVGSRGSTVEFSDSGHLWGDRFMEGQELDHDLQSDTWYTWEITYDKSPEGDGVLYIDIHDRDDGTLMGSVDSNYDVSEHLEMGPLAGNFGFYSHDPSMQVDNITLIPEPGTLGIIVLGGLALFYRRRR